MRIEAKPSSRSWTKTLFLTFTVAMWRHLADVALMTFVALIPQVAPARADFRASATTGFPIDKDAPAEILGLGTPKKIDAAVGETVEMFFDNFAFLHDPDSLRFLAQCSCSFGRMERRGWRGVPLRTDVGSHTLSWMVHDAGGKLLHQQDVTIRVDERVNRPFADLRLLFIGDSIMRQQYFPNEVYRWAQMHLAAKVSTVGRVSLNWDFQHYAQNALPGLFTESYNGWPTYYFVNENFKPSKTQNPESDVSRPPFWFGSDLENGELSYARYIREYSDGRFPEVVLVMLGTNDFAALGFDGEQVERGTDRAVGSLERLIRLIKADHPATTIFIVNPPPTSLSGSPFRINYGSNERISPLSMKYGHRILSRKLDQAFGGREKEGVRYVPAHVGFDPIDGYHNDQVVHPSAYGHRQIAGQVAAALNRWAGERAARGDAR